MSGKGLAAFWSLAKPYYAHAYQEIWVGFSLMGYFYYKLSYGGKKAVKGSKSSGHH